MDVVLLKGLHDKLYEKRKASALEVEKIIRDAVFHGDDSKIRVIISQLVELASSTAAHHSNTRNGGIMGLAGASIALGQQNIAPYLRSIAPPILACFHDPDHRVRYFACESMYNVAKVAKGEILVYFNELFDAMSKLAADVDQAVKNGGELLDRLIRDVVTEDAATYYSARPVTPDNMETESDSFRRSESESYGSPDGASVSALSRQTTKLSGTVSSSGRASDAQRTTFRRRKAFSLERFVPLLAERIYVINPFTRTFLVSWLNVLDAIPELELVAYLPHFLDGLLKFLGDPTEDIRNATMNVLADFLKEIRDAAEVSRAAEEAEASRSERRSKRQQREHDDLRRADQSTTREQSVEPGDISIASVTDASEPPSSRPPSRRQSIDRSSINVPHSPTHTAHAEQIASTLRNIDEEEDAERAHHNDDDDDDSRQTEGDEGDVTGELSEKTGSSELKRSPSSDDERAEEGGEVVPEGWASGRRLKIDHAAIVEILLQHLSFTDEEIQATCLRWIAEFLLFGRETMVTFTPRLIPVVLSSLAHHVPAISQAARQTNYNLFRMIQDLPVAASPPPSESQPRSSPPQQAKTPTPGNAPAQTHSRRESAARLRIDTSGKMDAVPFPVNSPGFPATTSAAMPNRAASQDRMPNLDTLVHELQLHHHQQQQQPAVHAQNGDDTFGDTSGETDTTTEDALDYQATVNALTLQFLNESEETRLAALHWLSMLHQKVPTKILSMNDGTFPVLLKTLSDPSEEVIKANLQLLAQISSSSEEDYFPLFMANLLSLFSTDRKLLETRGSLIIRQLCLNLNTERIYRTLADLLEKDEDLEFASMMVQNLHLIMITSPELSDFRKRLKNLETRDGQILFSALYRSWSHNGVAAFSLCLLAQAYEHAANLLSIFAELEVTVSLLIQIDKLVQLLESPVFTSLRLQLLEPDKHPYLYKCLYGLLMFLPQSSAFLTLRNRLNAVSPLGYVQALPRAQGSSGSSSGGAGAGISGSRSTIRRTEEIRWQELLVHFRQIQLKHERARRAHLNDDVGVLGSSRSGAAAGGGGASVGGSAGGSGLAGMGAGMNGHLPIAATLRSTISTAGGGSSSGNGSVRRKAGSVGIGDAASNAGSVSSRGVVSGIRGITGGATGLGFSGRSTPSSLAGTANSLSSRPLSPHSQTPLGSAAAASRAVKRQGGTSSTSTKR